MQNGDIENEFWQNAENKKAPRHKPKGGGIGYCGVKMT